MSVDLADIVPEVLVNIELQVLAEILSVSRFPEDRPSDVNNANINCMASSRD